MVQLLSFACGCLAFPPLFTEETVLSPVYSLGTNKGLLINRSSANRVSAKKLMLLNCGVGEDSRESLGLQGDPTSPS